MASVPIKNIILTRGSTYIRTLRWGAPPFVSKAITGITKAAPPVITAASHGLTSGWPVAVVGVLGMTEINAAATDLRRLRNADFNRATVLSASTVELNDVNASEYSTYSSGGFLIYRTPVSLAGYTARMHIRETYNSATAIVTLTSSSGIAIDDVAKTITYTITAAATAAITQSSAVYDFEMVSGAGVVTKLVRGSVVIEDEVTV